LFERTDPALKRSAYGKSAGPVREEVGGLRWPGPGKREKAGASRKIGN